MIEDGKVIVVDIDGTLAQDKLPGQTYEELQPIEDVKQKLVDLHEKGWRIILYTSRNMRSYDGNMGEILANTAPVVLDWLKRHKIPYNEIHFGKPWCGFEGFYVDDKTVRPREFLTLSPSEIAELLERDKVVS